MPFNGVYSKVSDAAMAAKPGTMADTQAAGAAPTAA
jgi:hypothetical protein